MARRSSVTPGLPGFAFARRARARIGSRRCGAVRRSPRVSRSSTRRTRRGCVRCRPCVWDDRGVRNRDPQRVSEERGHREPVGERADYRRLGHGTDVADPHDVVDHQRWRDLLFDESHCGRTYPGVGCRVRVRPPAATLAASSLRTRMERCQSGRMGCPAKALILRDPWVQIPPSPPTAGQLPCGNWPALCVPRSHASCVAIRRDRRVVSRRERWTRVRTGCSARCVSEISDK